MIGTPAALIGGGLLVGGSAYLSNKNARKAANASLAASETQADYEREALDYLKEREAIPQQYREGALNVLGGLSGLPGGTGSQDELIQRAIQSPLYQQLIGGQKFGEEAILRNASATGGLRSGNTSAALYDYNTQLQNNALLESYNQQLMGLQGMAGLPSMAPQIANQISGIGETLGQGQIAAAQARQTGNQNTMNNLMGVANLGLGMYGAGMFSDRRLKKNINKIGKVNGFNFYSFAWNGVAKRLGLTGNTYGCMADEVYEIAPEAVILKDGFMFIKYDMIGVL
jgi:hypothetical protein